MPKFRISFARTYSITEGFERVIDAPSEAEAQAAADNLAREFNDDCPDDCSEMESGDTEIGDFEATIPPGLQAGGMGIHSVDYTVLPDGQCVSGEGAWIDEAGDITQPQIDAVLEHACANGMHSWVDKPGERGDCTRCGEPYGDPK